MNVRPFALGFVIACIACSAMCLGGESAAKSKHSQSCGRGPCCCPPPIACCPDDYCRKPWPCIPCLSECWECDNYCRKPFPCIPCLSGCFTCDDYCRKPFPDFCWPQSPNLKCVSSCERCDDCQSHTSGHKSAPYVSPKNGGKQPVARQSH